MGCGNGAQRRHRAACRLELGFERYRFPGFSVPEGETAFSYLYQLAHAGLLRRYQPVTKRALSQLAHELDVIDRTNLSEFFLIVWDLMEFARTNDIIGQGRGSAGDSIVAYCLGITKVDPIEHKLLFERFINEARALPDIDIDFDVNRREEVIQYLYTKYGADHAAMVCTIVTYRARSAVREVAKALGFPLEGIDALAKALDTRDATDVARDLALDGSFGWLFDELGLDMADAAVPPGRDGRGTGIVHRQADSSWNPRPRPAIDLKPQPISLGSWAPGKKPQVLGPESRPVSEGGWYPPKRARVLDASVTTVRHESETTKRYARSGELAGEELALPTPRDNGSPGPFGSAGGHPHGAAGPTSDGLGALVGYAAGQALRAQPAITVLAVLGVAVATVRPRRLWRRTIRPTLRPGRRIGLVVALVGGMLSGAVVNSTPAAAAGPNCDTAPTRTFDVVAIDVDIVVNRYGDHDPYGYMYVLADKEDEVRAQEAALKAASSLPIDGPDGGQGLDRSRAGPDPAAGAAGPPGRVRGHQPRRTSCSTPRAAGPNGNPAITQPGGVPSVSIDMAGVAYDAAGGQGGQAVGLNSHGTVVPHRARPGTYRFYLDPLMGEGAKVFRSGGNSFQLTSHGLFGALVAEPAGARWYDPVTRRGEDQRRQLEQLGGDDQADQRPDLPRVHDHLPRGR